MQKRSCDCDYAHRIHETSPLSRRLGYGSLQQLAGFSLTMAFALLVLTTVLTAGRVSGKTAENPDTTRSSTTPPGFEDQKLAAFHRLGVNDRLRVSLFDGKELTTWEVTVDLDGNVELPYVGKVSLLGLKPSEAERALTDEFRVYYRAPWVSVEVEFFGEFEVFVFGTDFVGKVMRVPTGTRLLDALKAAVIPTSGSYRRIHLIRGGFDFSSLLSLLGEDAPAAVTREEDGARVIEAKRPPSREEESDARHANWRRWVEARKRDPLTSVTVIDPLVAVHGGDIQAVNVLLKPGDAIYVPAPERSVEIFGVVKPGVYELRGEETLGDLLYLTGSVNYDADLRNSVVERRDASGGLQQVVVNLSPRNPDLAATRDFVLEDHDIVRIIPQERRVFVFGEVFRAGAFSYLPNLGIPDYLAMAGGITDNANRGKLQLIRQPRDLQHPNEPTQVLAIDFEKLQKGEPLPYSYHVLPGDVIFVPHKGFRITYPVVVQTVATILTGFNAFSNSTETRPKGQEPSGQEPSGASSGSGS